jgi:hypothetical protein
MLAGCLAMLIACKAVEHIPGYPRGGGQVAAMMQLALLMIAGGGAYLGTCWGLGLRLRAGTRDN